MPTDASASDPAVRIEPAPVVADRPRLKVVHFVTGGFSGATKVAVTLVKAHMTHPGVEALLVLRRKFRTDPAKVAALYDAGIPLKLVSNGRFACIHELAAICWEFKPDVLVAHGFSEHLWGRYAGLLAKVPCLIQVEHNTRERYSWFQLWQSRWLARRTHHLVGCSEAVRQRLVEYGMPKQKTLAISNGIDLEPYAVAKDYPHPQRRAEIIMVSRFSKQKDQATLIHALALLKGRGYRPRLNLVGQGKLRGRAEALVRQLELTEQVEFHGYRMDIPHLLCSHRIAAFSTHYEGMPLALVESMAAGCAIVASAVPGVKEIISHNETGLLVEPASPHAMADALEQLLTDPSFAGDLGRNARQRALEEHGLELMTRRYHRLFLEGHTVPCDPSTGLPLPEGESAVPPVSR